MSGTEKTKTNETMVSTNHGWFQEPKQMVVLVRHTGDTGDRLEREKPTENVKSLSQKDLDLPF